MNFPLSVSNREPNNVLMFPDDSPYDKPKAYTQWMKLYQRITREALVYVLPGDDHLQDLPFVANLGCYLPHVNVMLLSRYTSKPRIGEEAVGRRFFESFDYTLRQPNDCWEGEADLKWMRKNLYVGGVGQRSTREAFRWMNKEFDMDVVEIEMIDPKLYHLDCVFMPLSDEMALVNTSALLSSDIDKLEKLMEIVPVPKQFKYEGWTNSLKLGDTILYGLSESHLEFERLFNVECIDLREFDKSGADLSCMVMHLAQ
jgi:N-dimethylarginine dimethylaminohydrolase